MRGSGPGVLLLRCIGVGLLLVLGAVPLRAQVAPLSTPDVGADETLERETLLAFEPLSLEDVLRHLVGVALSRRGAVGSLEYTQVLGALPGRVQLSLDGIDLAEPELAFPRLYAIPLAAIERIQVFRSTDPVRIEVWTRRHTTETAATEIDLGRGDIETRVRRLQLLLPPRWWWVGMRYDELLRGRQDFRPTPATAAPASIGDYDGRGRSLIFGFERQGGERLRVLLADDFDNAHGSYESVDEITGASRVLGSLRWWRPLRGWQLVADVTQQAWERSRGFSTGVQQITETYGRVAVDLEHDAPAGLGGALRLRAADVDGDREGVAPGPERRRFQRYDGELHLHWRGTFAWNGWVSVHHRTDLSTEWSARLHGEWSRGPWALHAQGGRGVSFAGWGESLAPGDDGARPGTFAAGGVRRQGERLTLSLTGAAKRFDRNGTATALLFPLLGSGPTRLAGGCAALELRLGSSAYPGALQGQLAWTPEVEGERGGLPELQAEVGGRVAAVQLFHGDLQVALRARWRLEARRDFTSSVSLAPYAAGDVRLDFRLLQRMLVYWDVQNVADTAVETHPGVLLPGRTSLVGVRVDLFD